MHGKKWKFIYLFIYFHKIYLNPPPPHTKKGEDLSAMLTGSCRENVKTMFRPVSDTVPSWTRRHQRGCIIPGKIVPPPGRNLFLLIIADSSCASLVEHLCVQFSSQGSRMFSSPIFFAIRIRGGGRNSPAFGQTSSRQFIDACGISSVAQESMRSEASHQSRIDSRRLDR